MKSRASTGSAWTVWSWVASFLLALFVVLSTSALAQDNLDVAAAGRSVVRVVVVPMMGGEAEGVNTGSGVAVAPDMILTNAHVVAEAAEGSAIIGVVPSEGRQRFTGQVLAYDPGRDLALIQIEGGRVTPATIATGPVPDGAAVAAVGYPFSVDRAREISAEGFVTPQAPVKSWGRASGGASSQRFDTVLHDAAIGRGSSGGPLVDACGRVVGINSFVSNSEGVDAVFGFAVSAREILPFLREAGVKPQTTAVPCRTSAEQAAIDEQLDRSEAARAEAARAQAASAEARQASRREQLRDQILAERDQGLAIAGLLLVFGALGLSGAMVLSQRKERGPALAALAAGGVLMAGAPVAWVARPDLDQVDARLKADAPEVEAAALSTAGDYLCRVDLQRSRLTVSEPRDLELAWTEGGCAGGDAQYAAQDGRWVRGDASASEPAAALRRFDPATGRYTVERYLLPADTLAAARALQSKYAAPRCTPDAARTTAELTAALRDLLPAAPNERLVYRCERRQDAPAKS